MDLCGACSIGAQEHERAPSSTGRTQGARQREPGVVVKKLPRKKSVAATTQASAGREDARFVRVVDIIKPARGHVSRSVNTTTVQAYWHIGREIVEVEQHDEKRAGQDFGTRTLRPIRQFYVTDPEGTALPTKLGGPAKRTAVVSKSNRRLRRLGQQC